MKYFAVVIVLLWFSLGAIGQSGNELFDETYIHEIRLDFSENDFWDTLNTRYDDFGTFSGEDIPYLAASVTIDGTVLGSDIGVRLKGKSSYFYVPNRKKPFKLDFNEFDEEQTFDGLKKVNLHNGFGDPSMMRDYLSYGLLRQAGVSAPRVAYAHLYLNNEYWGLYEMVEQIDKTFLKNNFADDDGNLWKNQRWSELKWYGDNPDTYRDTFELKTNTTDDDWSAFIRFLDILNNTSDSEFQDSIEAVFNVDQYLHVLAVDIMTNNWDSYIDNERNFYLYHEPKSGKIHWIPWDYNLSMGGAITVSGNPLPPVDPSCMLESDFIFSKDNNTIAFTEFSNPPAETWYWEFGDGTVSTVQNPSHFYDNSLSKARVCLTTTRNENGNTCEQKRCQEVNLSFDPASCNSIQNNSCPYPSSDVVFQQTIAEDPFCCNDTWDVFCEIKYQEIQNNPPSSFDYTVDYDYDFPLLLDNPDKILIDRILNIPEYRNRYLDICCVMMDKALSLPNLIPQINTQANLIRDAVHADPYYLYTHDYFEYDVGNGTGGGDTRIPSLQMFLTNRVSQLISDMVDAQHNCAPAFTDLEWHDLVINEFVASNQEAGGGTADPAGQYDDWIEIYNNTFQTVDLHGFYLSDNTAFPKRWIFPKGSSIAPGEYLMVWADRDVHQEGLHTDFGLSKSGDEIILVHEDETIIDMVQFGAQSTNTAWARIPNGSGQFVSQTPTFQQNNETVNTTAEVVPLSQIRLFPNPTNDYITIQTPPDFSLKDFKINMTNSVGEKIHEQFFSKNTNSMKLDVRHWSSGVYFLEIQNGESLWSNKVIIY